MSKEIKMSDYFCLPVLHDVYMQDEFAPVYAADCNRVVFKGWNEPALELACVAINNHDRLVEENKRLLEKLSDIHEYVSMIPLHLTDEKTHSNEHINHFVNQIKLLSELGGE